MKAVVQARRTGRPRRTSSSVDLPTPGPAPDEVLVRVHAASVHADVWHVVRGVPYVLRIMGAGLSRPKKQIPGTDVAGRVVFVGAHVTRFRDGRRRVRRDPSRAISGSTAGRSRSTSPLPEYALARPSRRRVTFEEAAAVPTSGIIALHPAPFATKAA